MFEIKQQLVSICSFFDENFKTKPSAYAQTSLSDSLATISSGVNPPLVEERCASNPTNGVHGNYILLTFILIFIFLVPFRNTANIRSSL